MKRMYVVTLMAIAGGVIVGCSAGKESVVQAQVRAEKVTCEDIPQGVCDFVAEHGGGLFPDLKGAVFAEFIPVQRWGNSVNQPMSIGWLLPKRGDDQYAVLPNGAVKKVKEAGAQQTLDEAVVRERVVPEMMQSIETGFRSMPDYAAPYRVMAVLVSVGRQDLAQVAWAAYPVQAKQNMIPPSADLVGAAFRFRREEISDAYAAQDWVWGLSVAKIIAKNEKIKPEYPAWDSFDKVTVNDVIQDLERRIADQRPLVDLRTVPNDPGPERWAQLLRAMDGSVVLDENGGNTEPSYLFTNEGEGAIPILLDDLKTENRLTLTNLVPVSHVGRLPGSVRRLVVQNLQQIWAGMPSDRLADLSDPEKAPAAVDWYLEKWKSYEGMRLSQRIFTNIQSGTMNEYQLSAAIKDLFAKAGPGSPAPYVPGKTPLNIDELSAEQKVQVAERLQLALGKIISDPRKNLSNSDNLVIGLAKLRGKESLPVLQGFSRDLLTMIQAERQNSALNRFGKAFGAVIAQRIAIGDRDAAMKDLFAVTPIMDQLDTNEFEVMRSAWEFPKDKELQGVVEKILTDWSKRKEKEGGSLHLNFVWPPRSAEVLRSPGVRSFIIKQLRDGSKYGEATITRVDKSSVSYSYKSPNSGGSSGVSTVPKNVKVGQVVAFSKGDFVADQMRRYLSDSEFCLVGSAEERRISREQMVKLLERGNIAGEKYNGVADLAIWRP